MEHLFLSRDQSMNLVGLGFDQQTLAYYSANHDSLCIGEPEPDDNGPIIPAPTIDQFINWLIYAKQLVIHVLPVDSLYAWNFHICANDIMAPFFVLHDDKKEYNSRPVAMNAAIDWVLKYMNKNNIKGSELNYVFPKAIPTLKEQKEELQNTIHSMIIDFCNRNPDVENVDVNVYKVQHPLNDGEHNQVVCEVTLKI